MFDRLCCAWSAFRWAWKHFDPVQEKFMDWPRHIESWMKSRMSFQIGDFDYIRGQQPYDARWAASNVIPNATEPYMLKKQCVDKDGNVRYFDVVPEGYERVDTLNVPHRDIKFHEGWEIKTPREVRINWE